MAPENSGEPNGDRTGHLVDLSERVQPRQSVILVTDDDLQVRKLVTVLMQQDGYCVLSAAGGQEGLALSRQYAGSIDLLITGVRMARLNGTNLCARLLDERPGIKVIFTISADLSEFFTPIADLPFLTKPINGHTLRAKVCESLGAPVWLPLDRLPSEPLDDLHSVSRRRPDLILGEVAERSTNKV